MFKIAIQHSEEVDLRNCLI